MNNIDLNFAKYCFSTQLARKELLEKVLSQQGFNEMVGSYKRSICFYLPKGQQQKIAKF